MKITHHRHLAALAAAVAVIGLSGCGSSGGSSDSGSGPTTSSSSRPSTTDGSRPPASQPSSSTSAMDMPLITIQDFAFDDPTSVKPGESVMVTNEDSSTHSVTSDQAGMFDVDVDAGGNAHFTAPSKPGSYPYHCKFHGDMHGTLVVK